MATLAEIRAVIARYAPVLTSGALMRIAEKEGWREDRSEGGHRIFIYPQQPSYGHITFKCHQEGADCNRIVTRRRLEDIYQPALDRAVEDAEQQQRLRQTINQLESVVAQCEADFVCEANLKLDQIEDQIRQCEDDLLEDWQRFIDDHQRQLLIQKEAELEQARQDVEHSRQQINRLEVKQRSLNEALAIAHCQTEKLTQQVHEQEAVIQEKQRDFAIARHQIEALQQELHAQSAQIELAKNQAHRQFTRDRRRMVWICLALLGLMGALTLKTCYSAPAPSPVPVQR